MRKEIIQVGKTVEDAINAACASLGCEREDAGWEIIDLPKKMMLGLKMAPAKVKVWVGSEEPEAPVLVAPTQQPKKEASVPIEKTEVFEKKEEVQKPRQKPDKPQYRPERHERSSEPIEITPEIEAKIALAIQYLQLICKDMGLEAEFVSRSEDGGVTIEVQGQGLGAIIGRRGETLDALQYLAGLVANRLDGEYLRITVDSGEYRTKRKDTLEALAKKLSAQVIKTNISKMLEPMNPFERRIIHATISEIEGVSSISVGEEPNRRVLIVTPTSKRSGRDGGDYDREGKSFDRGSRGGDRDRGGRGRDRDRRGGGSGGRDYNAGRGASSRDRGARSTMGGSINTLPQNRAVPDAGPKVTPEASGDLPLFAKLDLK